MPPLRGITWDHPRGYDPLVATARAYAASHPGVEIVWDRRSLQAFGDAALAQLAETYDLLVIDHPHVGEVARQGILVPLNSGPPTAGRSQESYEYDARVWALAIDASAQVSAYGPGRISRPPESWEEVTELARSGRVVWPLKPVDALMSFFTLAANRGTPCGARPGEFLDPGDAEAVLEGMARISRHLPAACLRMDPIEALDLLSGEDSFAYVPLLFAYSNYARDGFRRHRLGFAGIPGVRGSVLGGTGLAVSARSVSTAAAVDYAVAVAGEEYQKGIYWESGGQPAHAAAWDDERANAVTHGFFRSVRRTLDESWLRPRHAGYLRFQDAGGALINAFLRGEASTSETVRRLESSYAASMP